jgi:integrase
MLEVIRGKDVAAKKRAGRQSATFGALAERYLEEHAKRKNKSWREPDKLVRRYLLPAWDGLSAASITRSDVRALVGKINAPVQANQVLAAASAIFTWTVRQEIVPFNPCRGVERNATTSRDRVLSDSELPLFWRAFNEAGMPGVALKVLLLTGQRPGEVARMRHEHITAGWWTLPGAPDAATGWRGTKNAQSHRVWLPTMVRDILADLGNADDSGFVFGKVPRLTDAMRAICARLGVPRATPHDLRRTHGSTVTRLGFGREAMNRVQNHKEGGVTDVYDRHSYSDENMRVMEAVAAHLLTLALR